MYSRYQITPLGVSDLQKLMEIERGVFEQPWSASIMRDSLRAAHCSVWGLYSGDDSQLIGFGVITTVMDESELIDMAIAKQYQGKGYGKKLMKFLIDKARQNGAEKMFLEVGVNNAAAKAMYLNLNFKSIDTRKNYYRRKNNTFEDAIVYQLELR
jgi:[ribosomal protein S18]-alanine N-acetyltransferase